MNIIKMITNGNKVTADVLSKVFADAILSKDEIKSVYMFIATDRKSNNFIKYTLNGDKILKETVKSDNQFDIPVTDKQIISLIGMLDDNDWFKVLQI